MTTAEKVLIVTLVVNTLISVAYFIWGCIIQVNRKEPELPEEPDRAEQMIEEMEKEEAEEEEAGKEEQEEEEPEGKLSRTGYLFKALVMFLCPVVGVLFFLATQLMYVLFFRTKADLTDVIFGKEKVVTNRKADEDSERNRVPIEEALAVADKESLRSLVMDVVKGDVQKSLGTIALALNSEDTETSHYAASVLRDALNDFRQESQELFNAIHRGDDKAPEYACALIEYMNGVLSQEVFPDMEQRAYVRMMEDACTWLYRSEEHRYRLICEYIEWIAMRLLRIGEYERMETWCNRCMEIYPEELTSYTLQLKLYFSTQNKEKFFDVMNRLKQSDIVIDRDTLDLIRVFS